MSELALKWRRSELREDSFLGFDPERYEDIEVVGIHETNRWGANIVVWDWQVYILPTAPYAGILQTRNGSEDDARSAARAAEACYRRFLEVMPAEVIAYDFEFKKHGREVRANWARKYGPQPSKVA